MVRDLDLVRAILLELDKVPFRAGWVDLEIDGYTPEQIAYHVLILADQGFIEAVDLSTHDSPWPDWRPVRLTGQGHDFLDAIRNQTIWRKAKDRLGSEALTAPLAIVKAIATELISNRLGFS